MSAVWTKIAEAAGNSTTTVNLTTIADCPAGTKIVVAMQGGNNTTTASNHITGVTDGNSNAYTVRASTQSGNNAGTSVADADNASDLPLGSTITVTLDSAATSSGGHIWVYSVTNLATGAPLDAFPAHGSAGAAPTATGTVSVSGEVSLFGVVAHNGNEATTAGTGFTLLDSNATTKSGGTEQQDVASASGVQTVVFGTSTNLWSMCGIAYQVSAGVTPKSSTDSGSGSAVSTEQASYPRTESGSGSDASSEHAAYPRTDSATGADASSVSTTGAPHGTDSGHGTDASTQKVVLARTDSGSGADASHSYRNRTESGTGADTSKSARSRTDSASGGTQSSTLKATLPRTESGSGADVSSLNTGATVKHVTDSAFGTDLSFSTVLPADAGVHLSSIVQGSDGTLWLGNAVGVTDQRYIAKSTNSGNTWTWVTPSANINHTIWNTTRTWWLTGAFPDMNGKAYSVSQLKVDPVDPTIVYSCGRAGVWQTRDGGNTWRPAMNGQDGSESNAFAIGSAGEAWASDTDYNSSHTTDFWNQANKQNTGLPTFQTPSISRTVGSNTYVISNSSPPATLKINGGADKFNDFAKSACMNPKDIGIMSDGTIVVALSGGVLVGRPSGSNYIWSKGGNSGGGYCNAMDVDPRGGAVTLAGDVWGFNASTDGGNNFYPTNYGQGAGSNVPYGRAVCYSQKNPDRCYVGVGTLVFASGTGGGYLGVIDQSAAHAPYQLDQLNSTVSFTTHLGTGNASDLPRPVGNLIAVDYDSDSGIEYLYCLTRQGLKMSTNDGVTLVDLGLPAPPDPSAWKALCVLPNGDLLVATFRTSNSNSGSILYWVQNPRLGSPTIQEVDGVPPVIEDICVTTLGGRQVTMLACGINGLIRMNGLFVETPTVPTVQMVSGADAATGTETRVLKAVIARTEAVIGVDVSQVVAGGRIPITGTTEIAQGTEVSVRIAQPTILRD